MPVSVRGASAATFAHERHAHGSRRRMSTAGVAADHNVRRRRGDDRDAQLIAARLRCGQTMSTTVTDQLFPCEAARNRSAMAQRHERAASRA